MTHALLTAFANAILATIDANRSREYNERAKQAADAILALARFY